MERRFAFGVVGVAAMLVCSLGAAQPAAAEAPKQTLEHCAVEVAEIGQSEVGAEPTCFSSIEEVGTYLADMDVSERRSNGSSLMTSTVLGTVYKDSYRGGASLTFWGSGSCAGATYGFASLAAGWSSSISSAEGKNGCWLTLYTGTSYGGSSLNCTPYCGTIGGWNDNVGSVVFRPTGTYG